MGPRWYCETSEALFASQNRQHTHCFNSVIHCVSPSVCTAWTSWSTRLQLTSDRVLNSWSDGDQSWLCLAIVASIPRLPTTSLIRWRCHSVARFCPYHWACKDWFPRVAVWSHAAAVRPQFILLFLRWASGSRKSRGFSFFPAFLTQSRHGSTGVFFLQRRLERNISRWNVQFYDNAAHSRAAAIQYFSIWSVPLEIPPDRSGKMCNFTWLKGNCKCRTPDQMTD